jgi:hypothetical protein
VPADDSIARDDVAIMIERIAAMPIYDPTWDPSLLGMPWEVRKKIFGYASVPPQSPNFSSDVDMDKEIIKKYGKFALQLRREHQETNNWVMAQLTERYLGSSSWFEAATFSASRSKGFSRHLKRASCA